MAHLFKKQGRTSQSWACIIAMCGFALLSCMISPQSSAAQSLSSVGFGDETLVCGQDEIPVLSIGAIKIRTKTKTINLRSAKLCLGVNSIRRIEFTRTDKQSSKMVPAGGYWAHNCLENNMPLAASGQTRIKGANSDYFVEISAENGIATCLNLGGKAKDLG